MSEEISVLWVLFSRKQSFVQFFADSVKGDLIESGAGPISDPDLISLCKLPIKNKNNIRLSGPLILFDQLELTILPFNKTAIILPLGILVPIDLNQMLDFIHKAASIVTLGNVHREAKHLHVLFGLDYDVLVHALEALDLYCHFGGGLFFYSELHCG